MFKFFGKVFKRTAHECMQHDHTKFPNILANEHCRSCEQDICYMCGNEHINNHHPVQVSRHSVPTLPESSILTEREKINLNILREFNTGSLIHLDINKLKCICGKPANEHTAICAACGSATCSQECHHELEKQDKCKFHHNFTENAKNKSLRSILIKYACKYPRNAFFLYDKGYSQGTVFSRTSQHFISSFLTSQRHAIYLQRGYRQYGNPDASTLNAMDIVKGADLDREVHLMKVCQCKCSYCSQIGHHPVHLCSAYCKAKDLFIMRSYAQENPAEKDDACQCKCTFCTSSHTVLVHKKVDCCLKCEFRSKVDY